MENFKEGDKVYDIIKDGYIYTLKKNYNKESRQRYPLGIHEIDVSYTFDGKRFKSDATQSIFHATKENYELLSKLFPYVQWEKPKRILKGSELCKHLLKTQPHVFCRVSNFGDEDALIANAPIRCIVGCRREAGFTFEVGDSSGAAYNYAVPINTETLQPLEMEVDNERKN